MIDQSVWLVKSHWPERRGRSPFTAHAAVLLVRSPLDVIDSYWNLVLTASHNHSVEEREYERLSGEWQRTVKQEIDMWAAYHRYWLKAATAIPVLYIRYEDLLQPESRKETLQLVAAFLCERACTADGASGSGSRGMLVAMLERVERAAAQIEASGTQRAGVYAPRRGAAGASIGHFSRELREAVAAAAAAELCLFKYESNPASDHFGLVLPGGVHSVYFEPHAELKARVVTEAGAEMHLSSEGLVLNQGTPLRPPDDPRGWRLRGRVAERRDGSLILDERAIARVVVNKDAWTARLASTSARAPAIQASLS